MRSEAVGARMRKLKIVEQPIEALAPRAGNARTHSPKQIQQIADSITRFGFTNPLLVDDSNGVIAGHGRLAAAKLLGFTSLPTIRLSRMSEEEVRAYCLADNKLAENAGWDRDMLAIEFKYLEELDFDISLTGFAAPEIDVVLGAFEAAGDAADALPALESRAVTRPGDVWLIGSHKLICGDSTKAETYPALLGEARADLVFADLPFNVPTDGHIGGAGAIKHREFAMARGEMSKAQFTSFLTIIFSHLATFSKDASIHFQCMDFRHMGEMITAGEAAYSELKNLVIWTKQNAGMGGLYRSQHELIFVFKSGAGAHINNIQLGRYGRNRSNVWSYPGVNGFGAERENLKLHPTVKPTALVADAIRDCSKRGALVLDPCAGSGTTLVAAHKTGRIGAGIEIDTIYCDVIVRRMLAVCGLSATLEATGEPFEAVAAQRQAEGVEAQS
jgi:DNA modification methylase